MEKFNLKEFATNNNVTIIELKDEDFLYIQIPRIETDSVEDRKIRLMNAIQCFNHFLPKTKILVDDEPLKFTVITKKEEFVARLNDSIVQL